MVQTKRDIKDLIIQNKALIAGFGAKSLGLFGSFTRNDQDSKSDVDLLVEFVPGKKNYDNYINLAYFLEDLFGRKVELITPNGLSKYLKKQIIDTTEYVSLGV